VSRDDGRHLGVALLIIATAQLMVVLDATIVNVALPRIQAALGFSGGLDFHSLRPSYVTHLSEDGWDPLFVQLLFSPRKGVHDVQHEPGVCGNLRAGGGYLRSSVTQIPRRFGACAAGADARLVG